MCYKMSQFVFSLACDQWGECFSFGSWMQNNWSRLKLAVTNEVLWRSQESVGYYIGWIEKTVTAASLLSLCCPFFFFLHNQCFCEENLLKKKLKIRDVCLWNTDILTHICYRGDNSRLPCLMSQHGCLKVFYMLIILISHTEFMELEFQLKFAWVKTSVIYFSESSPYFASFDNVPCCHRIWHNESVVSQAPLSSLVWDLHTEHNYWEQSALQLGLHLLYV